MFGNAAKKKANETHDMMLQLIADDIEMTQFTPDAYELNRHKSQLLFIHDDMAQLQPNHDMVKAGSLSGFYPFNYGYTTKKFSFVKKELGLKSFPIALQLNERDEYPMYIAEEYRIRGEIYAVRPSLFYTLDTHRQNGVQFVRIPVNVNVGSRKLYRTHYYTAEGVKKYNYDLGREEMQSVICWMYVGREEYWKDQLKAGFFDFKPVTIIQEDRLWLKEYYQYSRVR